MKKTSILIAMFAVIAAAPAAWAQPGFDFDGRNPDAISFTEAVKAVEVPQDMKTAPEKITWPLNELNDACLNASMCGGMHYLADDCTCKPLPEYQDFYNHISSAGSAAWWAYSSDMFFAEFPNGLPMVSLPSPAGVRGLAAYYPAQKGLRDLILAQFNVHDAFSSNIFHVLNDGKSMIVYNDKGVYIANGGTIYGTNDKKLVRRVLAAAGGQTRFGWVDVGAAAVFGCVFSSECREDVANYVNNLHDDEHDTYHNNHDGSSSNYEVNKKVK